MLGIRKKIQLHCINMDQSVLILFSVDGVHQPK